MNRIFAIGDVHGCSAALAAVIAAIEIERDDTVVTLGDYVSKGPDSRGVIDLLNELKTRCFHIPLLGNHDRMMLAALDGELSTEAWSMFGSDRTLDSYDSQRRISQIPRSHHDFLRSCKMFHETERHLLTHANYHPKKPLTETDESTLLWEKIGEEMPDPHESGKIAVVGHTSQASHEVLDAKHLICIDTACWSGGWLTALELHSGTVLQADRDGKLRTSGHHAF